MNKTIRWTVFILAMLSVMVWITYKSKTRAQESIPPYHCALPQSLFPKALYKGEIREARLTLIRGGQEIFLCINGNCAREAPNGIPGIVNMKQDLRDAFSAKLYMVEQTVFDELRRHFENVATPEERIVAGSKVMVYLIQYMQSSLFRQTEGWRMVFTMYMKLNLDGSGIVFFEDAYGQNLGATYVACAPGE